MFNKFIPEYQRKINMVVTSAHWMNYLHSGGYSSHEELGEGINSTIKALEKMKIKVLVLGQGEGYNIDYPRVVAFELEGKSHGSYINEAAVVLNNDLKRLVPAQNYINIFLINEINHYDSINKTPYMFDDDHLTMYGANQTVDFLLKKKIF